MSFPFLDGGVKRNCEGDKGRIRTTRQKDKAETIPECYSHNNPSFSSPDSGIHKGLWLLFYFLGNKDRERTQYLTEKMLKINPPFYWLMPKGSEIHHSQSLPAQKANHLSRGTGTTPHPPRRRVISRGSIQAAIASLYPPCQQRRRDARAEDETARRRSSRHSLQQMGKQFGWSRVSQELLTKRERLWL